MCTYVIFYHIMHLANIHSHPRSNFFVCSSSHCCDDAKALFKRIRMITSQQAIDDNTSDVGGSEPLKVSLNKQ